MIIGFVLYRILMNVDLPVGNTLPDMIITIILCVIAGAVLHCGYYRRFIEGFSKIAKPMTSLLEKGKEFKWDEKCQESFDQLKERLMSPPVLIMPDLQKGFDIYCDACGLGLGCVLMQEGHVIAYASRQLRKH